MTTETTTRIAQLKRIVDNHQAGLVDGQWVDATTANMLVTIHAALSEENQAKFERLSLMRLVEFGWSRVKVVR